MFQLLNPPAGDDREICVTMDLRRSFKTDPSQDICNLSATITPRTYRVEEEVPSAREHDSYTIKPPNSPWLK